MCFASIPSGWILSGQQRSGRIIVCSQRPFPGVSQLMSPYFLIMYLRSSGVSKSPKAGAISSTSVGDCFLEAFISGYCWIKAAKKPFCSGIKAVFARQGHHQLSIQFFFFLVRSTHCKVMHSSARNYQSKAILQLAPTGAISASLGDSQQVRKDYITPQTAADLCIYIQQDQQHFIEKRTFCFHR